MKIKKIILLVLAGTALLVTGSACCVDCEGENGQSKQSKNNEVLTTFESQFSGTWGYGGGYSAVVLGEQICSFKNPMGRSIGFFTFKVHQPQLASAKNIELLLFLTADKYTQPEYYPGWPEKEIMIELWATTESDYASFKSCHIYQPRGWHDPEGCRIMIPWDVFNSHNMEITANNNWISVSGEAFTKDLQLLSEDSKYITMHLRYAVEPEGSQLCIDNGEQKKEPILIIE